MTEVTLVDSMGTDLSVVNAARVSFGKKHDTLTQGDKGLIKFLAKHTGSRNRCAFWVTGAPNQIVLALIDKDSAAPETGAYLLIL